MTEALADKLIIVGNASDDPFAIDLAYAIGQNTDIADLISMKTFANGEFCPRFISCLLYTSPSPRDRTRSRMPSSA